MREAVAAVHDLVSRIDPHDPIEARHRAATLDWLRATDDVFRRVKPAVPVQHLVSYVNVVDPSDGSMLLVDHVNAGLWLPPGGHVEPDEHPRDTAVREITEELGLTDAAVAQEPLFLTVTGTVGIDAGHTDVSLWFVLRCDQGTTLTADHEEFRRTRWWTPAELRSADPARFDPHLFRFVDKLAHHGAARP